MYQMQYSIKTKPCTPHVGERGNHLWLVQKHTKNISCIRSTAFARPSYALRLHQRRVLKGGADINLTRLEYGALCCLATSPGRVFTKAQIFETVWSMESESCQSSVANVICNLRKKIEPDNRKPTYIKTVIGVGYKFVSRE